MKVYMQTILAPVVSNLLYFAIFGISLNRTVPIEGINFLQFLVPGLITMGLINNAFQNPSSSMIQMKYQGLISDLMSIPLNRLEIFIAFISAAILRALIVGFVTFLTAIFFVDFTYNSIPTIIFTALMISLFFSSLGLIVGMWAKEFDKLAFFQNFLLMPLIFLGGVFYPITKLPGIFQTVSHFNPIVYMIDLLRYGFLGVHELPTNLSLLILTTATLLSSAIAYQLLKKGYQLQN